MTMSSTNGFPGVVSPHCQQDPAVIRALAPRPVFARSIRSSSRGLSATRSSNASSGLHAAGEVRRIQ